MQKPIGGRSRCGSAEKMGVYLVLANFQSNSILKAEKRVGGGGKQNYRYLSEGPKTRGKAKMGNTTTCVSSS